MLGMSRRRSSRGIMDASTRKTYMAGQALFLEGDNSHELYMLLSGGVDIQMHGQTIASVNEGGSVFGEVSFLLESPRTATVIANQPSEFLVIHDVGSLVDTNPMLIARIARLLAQRLKEMDERFVRLSQSVRGG